MPTAIPEAGTNIVAATTRSLQVPVIVAPTIQFGVAGGDITPLAVFLPTRGMSTIRCQLMHYPIYAPTAAMASAWVARNYLMYRVVGAAAPFKPTNLAGYTLGGTTGFTPLTPARLLPVGPAVELVFSGAGFEVIWVEFDTTAGTVGPQQGYDLVLVTFTASGT